MPIPLNPLTIPPRKVVMMTYADRRNLTETAVSAGVWMTYSLNGPWDPYITGAGVQPLFFGTWMGVYQRYRVLRTRVEATFSNTLAGSTSVGVVPSYNNTMLTTSAAWLVQPNGSTKILGSVAGNQAVQKIDRVYTPSAVLGVSKATYASDMDFTGSQTSNPTRQAFLLFWSLGTSTASIVDVILRITYEVELFNPMLTPFTTP